MLTFICYPKCTTCQKARKWLEDNGVEFRERHIKEDNPTKKREQVAAGEGGAGGEDGEVQVVMDVLVFLVEHAVEVAVHLVLPTINILKTIFLPIPWIRCIFWSDHPINQITTGWKDYCCWILMILTDEPTASLVVLT